MSWIPTVLTVGSSILSGAASIGSNLTLNGLNNSDELFQLGMYAQQIQHQEQMQVQSEAFDEMMDEKSEQMREVNTLRDVQMAQQNCRVGNQKAPRVRGSRIGALGRSTEARPADTAP
jgi:hypothetical protein